VPDCSGGRDVADRPKARPRDVVEVSSPPRKASSPRRALRNTGPAQHRLAAGPSSERIRQKGHPTHSERSWPCQRSHRREKPPVRRDPVSQRSRSFLRNEADRRDVDYLGRSPARAENQREGSNRERDRAPTDRAPWPIRQSPAQGEDPREGGGTRRSQPRQKESPSPREPLTDPAPSRRPRRRRPVPSRALAEGCCARPRLERSPGWSELPAEGWTPRGAVGGRQTQPGPTRTNAGVGGPSPGRTRALTSGTPTLVLSRPRDGASIQPN